MNEVYTTKKMCLSQQTAGEAQVLLSSLLMAVFQQFNAAVNSVIRDNACCVFEGAGVFDSFLAIRNKLPVLKYYERQ